MGTCNYCELKEVYLDRRFKKDFETFLVHHPSLHDLGGIWHVYQNTKGTLAAIPEYAGDGVTVASVFFDPKNRMKLVLVNKVISYKDAFMLIAWSNSRGMGFFHSHHADRPNISEYCVC